MTERIVRKLLMGCLFCVLLILSGCATTETQTFSSPPPDWVVSTPRDSDGAAYFVGSSQNTEGNLAQAEENATYSLIAEITRFLGVRVTTETTSEAKASLDTFTASIRQEVKQTGSARLSGFQIADRWVHEQDGRITVYLLGKYDRKELLEEKRRLARIFQEKADAVARPEEEARQLELTGDYFSALKKYASAAAAAWKSDIENGEIKFERNLNSLKELISQFSISVVHDIIEGPVGVPFQDSLQIRLQMGEGENSVPVEGASFDVTYREFRNGRPHFRTISLLSDEQGVVSFTPPPASAVGTEKVSFYLDLSPYLEPLLDVPSELKSQVTAVEDLALSKRASLTYSAFSLAKDIPTGVVILDVDKASNPIEQSYTATGVMQSLTQAGFQVSLPGFDSNLLKGMGDTQIAQLMKKTFDGQVVRVVYGVIGIEDFSQDGEHYVVKVSGSVKTIDVPSGKILYSNQQFIRSMGKNPSSAISSAFHNLGLKFGEDLAARLP